MPQDGEETIHLMRCVNNIPGIDVVFVPHHSGNGSNWLGTFKVTATDEHLGEFIASSVLAAIMTYANLRLSAEMSLFIRKKIERHVQLRLKVEKQKTITLPRPFICVGFVQQMLPWNPIGTLRNLEELI